MLLIIAIALCIWAYYNPQKRKMLLTVAGVLTVLTFAVLSLQLFQAGSNNKIVPYLILQGIAIGFFLVVGLFIFLLLRRFQPMKPSGLHGTSEWMMPQETARMAKPNNTRPTPGTLCLAPFGQDSWIELPRDLVVRHVMVLGPSGAGKSRSIFMPNLVASSGQSFATTDIKGELFTKSSGFHSAVRRYAPTEPDHSECFNWIPRCSDSRIARKLAKALALNGNTGSTDQVWIDGSENFFTALFSHAATLEAPTPATAANLVGDTDTQELFETLRNSPSRIARQAIRALEKGPERMRGSIILACANKLLLFADDDIARFTSSSTRGTDFTEMRRQPVGVYWVLPEGDVRRLATLTALFFTLMLHDLKEAKGVSDARPVPVTLYLDEFANAGIFPDFDTEITVCRGYDIGLVLALQAPSQVETNYGHTKAATIIENGQTKVILPGLGQRYSEEVSRLLGNKTVIQQSKSVSPTGGLMGHITYTSSEMARPLMTPDEIRRLPTGQMIVVSTNKKPMWLHHFWYDRPDNPAQTRPLGPVIEQRFETEGTSSRYSMAQDDDDQLEPLTPIN